MDDCVKNFNSNKTIYFRVSDNKLLKRYSRIWKKKPFNEYRI